MQTLVTVVAAFFAAALSFAVAYFSIYGEEDQ